MGEGLDREEKTKIKHNDFWIYDMKFHHRLGVRKEELSGLAKQANRISIAEITPEDIEDVERILVEDDLNDSLRGQGYQFYTEKRLDELLEDMIESFMNDYIYTRNRI